METISHNKRRKSQQDKSGIQSFWILLTYINGLYLRVKNFQVHISHLEMN